MKTKTICTWRLRAETTGKLHRSRWKMTREEALARDPLAVPVEGSEETREVYEEGDELPRGHSTANFNGATFG